MGVSRAGAVSMHERLAARLREVVAGAAPDSQMPTEMALVEQYGVSRTTVRRALTALVEEGLLVRRQGAGTFVAPRRIVHPLDRLRPFVSVFSGAGEQPEGRLLRFEWTENPTELATLGVDSGLAIRRLFTIGGEPQAVADIIVPKHIGEHVSRAQLEAHPIYRVLQEDLGLTLAYGDVRLLSVGAPPHLTEPLGVAEGDPLLVLSRTTFDDGGRPVEHSVHHLLPHRFELRLRVEASEPEPVSYSFARRGPELVMLPDEGGED